MGPFAFCPGVYVFQVVREVYRLDLVVHEFSYVPWQVIVPEKMMI